MAAAAPSPLLFPLAGLLKARGARVVLNCDLSKPFIGITNPPLQTKELNVIVPVFAWHRTYVERRMVVGLGTSLESWRDRLRFRGVNLLSVSAEGLCSNVEGIADQVCEHLFRVSIENLREMIQAGMTLTAIHAFTGIDPREIARMVPRFYGMTVDELRESLPETK